MSTTAQEQARQHLDSGQTDAAIRVLEQVDIGADKRFAEQVLRVAAEIRPRVKRGQLARCDRLIVNALGVAHPLPRGGRSGWYADPAGVANARYFGVVWTTHAKDMPPQSIYRIPVSEPVPAAPPPEPEPVIAGSVPGTKVCPRCAEEVKEAAAVCRFCRHEFNGPAAVSNGPAVSAAPVTAASSQPSTPPTTSGAAIASFICSLLGLWIAGIPLGIHAQKTIDQSGGRITGRGFATAGVVLGILGIIGTIILVAVIVHAANQTPSCTMTYNATGGCVPGT